MTQDPTHGFGKPFGLPVCRLLFVALLLAAVARGVPTTAQDSAETALQLAAVTAPPDAPLPQPSSETSSDSGSGAVTIRNTPVHILRDQEAIWTSPARIRKHQLIWLLPLAAATGVSLATDSHTMRDVVSHNPTFNHDNVDASNAMLAVLIAVPLVDFSYGEIAGDDHHREAGTLGGETLVDAAAIEEGTKLIFWRERPGVDNADGKFWQSSAGLDSSFPSSHSVFAWSTAAVIAGEHPARWSQFTVYTLATGVSLTRVLGQEHFPTDVLVGSAAGWLAGHYVYKVRHRWQRGIR
jgi:PAP2 superfamily